MVEGGAESVPPHAKGRALTTVLAVVSRGVARAIQPQPRQPRAARTEARARGAGYDDQVLLRAPRRLFGLSPVRDVPLESHGNVVVRGPPQAHDVRDVVRDRRQQPLEGTIVTPPRPQSQPPGRVASLQPRLRFLESVPLLAPPPCLAHGAPPLASPRRRLGRLHLRRHLDGQSLHAPDGLRLFPSRLLPQRAGVVRLVRRQGSLPLDASPISLHAQGLRLWEEALAAVSAAIGRPLRVGGPLPRLQGAPLDWAEVCRVVAPVPPRRARLACSLRVRDECHGARPCLGEVCRMPHRQRLLHYMPSRPLPQRLRDRRRRPLGAAPVPVDREVALTHGSMVV